MSSTTTVMNSSLIDKFRGAWLGSYLDAIKAPSQDYEKKFLAVGKIARLGAQSLVKVGYLDLVHWQEQIHIEDNCLLNLAGTLQIGEVIQTALPVILFYHEQPSKLAPALLSILDFWLYSSESAVLGLEVAGTIAHLLRRKPDPQEMITQTNLGELLQLSPQFWQELPCLELAIKEISRHTAPSDVPIAIACYCFLCTPEDFSLSIRRAKIAPKSELVTPLVGIFSGAYNGLRGFPWQWIGDDQYQLIDQLFAVWAGHYQISANPMSWQNQIVTVPR